MLCLCSQHFPVSPGPALGQSQLSLIQMLSTCLRRPQMIKKEKKKNTSLKASTYSTLSIRCPGRVVLSSDPQQSRPLTFREVICAASPSGHQGSMCLPSAGTQPSGPLWEFPSLVPFCVPRGCQQGSKKNRVSSPELEQKND